MRISDWSSDVCSSDLAGKFLARVRLSCVAREKGEQRTRPLSGQGDLPVRAGKREPSEQAQILFCGQVCGPLHDHSPPWPVRHRRRPTGYSRHDRQSTASKRPLVDALFTLAKTRRRRAADGQDLSSMRTGVQRDFGSLRRQTLREDSSMKLLFATIALLATLIAQPLRADDGVSTQKIISEAEVRAISEITYTDLLAQAFRKGWRFNPESIQKGYQRHFEEFKLQLINDGYTILAGEVGA